MSGDPLLDSPTPLSQGAALMFLIEGRHLHSRSRMETGMGRERPSHLFRKVLGSCHKLLPSTQCHGYPQLQERLEKCLYSEWPLPTSLLHLYLPFLSLALIWRAPTHPVSTSTLCVSNLYITQVSADCLLIPGSCISTFSVSH